MSDVLDRQERREVRGSILRTLSTVYGRNPETVSLRSLQHVLRNVSERDLLMELQYLFDLQYIARVQEKRDALDKDAPVYWRLIAKGAQVLNGDLADPSIEL